MSNLSMLLMAESIFLDNERSWFSV